MILWLARRTLRHAPRRVLLWAAAVAFPVAMLAATLLFVDVAVRSMTAVALEPVQVEMRALATSLNVDMTNLSRRLAAVPGVRRVDRFAAADVVVGVPGAGRFTARLFAVDPPYLAHHPWVGVIRGSLRRGALFDQALLVEPGYRKATKVSIALPGEARGLRVSLAVGGAADLRQATTWFAIPIGEVQGDIAMVPRAIVIDYATFERRILPALRASLGPTTPVLNPGLTDLPPVTLEAHVSVDHHAYPSDPGNAVAWSAGMQRVLERQVPGASVVADDGAEALMMAQDDATNAKILFLLLGIPGVLAAAALGLAAESALAEAHRREEALLALRGATDTQLARLAAASSALAGLAGIAIGLVAAALAVTAVVGYPAWRDIPAGRLAVSALVAAGAGALVTVVRLLRVRRAARQSQVALQRRVLERGWSPPWRRARLDLVAIAVGLVILTIDIAGGGLKHTPIEGPTVALSFYVLLAPIALWLGLTMLAVRGLFAALGRRARAQAGRPLGSWRLAAWRWLARRPARAAVTLLLGALAAAFATEVVAFVATYRAAKRADARAAFGSDLRLVAAPADIPIALPPLGRDVAATTPIRFIGARAGSDRKTILAIDPATYAQAVTSSPQLLEGGGVDALARTPMGVLVAKEIATDFVVKPGDPLPITLFPDDEEKKRNVRLHVVGVYRSVPPTAPPAELVMSTASFPSFLLPPSDFFLARVARGRSPAAVAREVRRSAVGRTFGVSASNDRHRFEQRSLAALNLDGLSRLESFGAGLIAALGVAILGTFVVLERRREFAVLRAVGADTGHVLTGPLYEGVFTVVASALIGIPLGLGLGLLAVRVLTLFFTLPPPLLAVPAAPLAGFVAFMVVASAVALGAALVAITRASAAAALREPW